MNISNFFNIFNFETKKIELLTKKTAVIKWKCKICYIPKEKVEDKYAKGKKYNKVRDHSHYAGEYRGAAHSIRNLKYSITKEISIIIHKGSNCDYHFIIKELAQNLPV